MESSSVVFLCPPRARTPTFIYKNSSHFDFKYCIKQFSTTLERFQWIIWWSWEIVQRFFQREIFVCIVYECESIVFLCVFEWFKVVNVVLRIHDYTYSCGLRWCGARFLGFNKERRKDRVKIVWKWRQQQQQQE